MSTCSSMGVHLSIKKKKKTFISWLLWEQRNRANRAMEQWVFSKHNRCLPLFFNSIFFPPLAPLSLALSMVARHFWIHEYIYIYIFAINRENPLDRVDASRIAGGGGGGGELFEYLLDGLWELEDRITGIPADFFSFGGQLSCSSGATDFRTERYRMGIYLMPIGWQMRHGLTDFKYGFPPPPPPPPLCFYARLLISIRLHAFIF